jgi:membrane-bound lytic murein transglycosylase D
MQPERISRGLAAAPPGVSQPVWMLLLTALALSTGIATWRVRSMEMRRAPAIVAAPVPEPAPRRSGESLATVRNRLAANVERTPAAEVDEWTLRLATSPGYNAETRRALERMRHLEPVIRAALARERIPRDLLYLALVESSFRPAATSRVGAAGVWQFMPGTARGYGWRSGPGWTSGAIPCAPRTPPRATCATSRAARRMAPGRRRVQLRLGCVRRALRLHGGGPGGGELRYWRIRPYLPRETRDYVPKAPGRRAHRARSEAFGFGGVDGDAPLDYREVVAPGGTSLERVARWAGAPETAVAALNPHLVRGQTPPGRRWAVRIPIR